MLAWTIVFRLPAAPAGRWSGPGFGTLHWSALGLSTAWSGTLWAISIVAEVGLFAYSAAVVRRIGPAPLIVLGAGGDPLVHHGSRSAALCAAAAAAPARFDVRRHAVGAIHCIGRAVPEAQAGTAQALYSSVTGGIVTGGATLIAGPLYAAYAGRVYWVMALLAAGALWAGLALARVRRGAC